jgi:peptidyl-prolyl cis-trans isomerase D
MFDAVRNNKRIVQAFLALITLPFAFWGIDFYFGNPGAGSDLASVGDTKIAYFQFEQALRERQDQLRKSLGDAFRQEMMNLPQVRLGILNGLIDERLLLLEAARQRVAANDQALQDSIASDPALQENGVFSKQRYEILLRAEGMSPAQFEARERQNLTLRQLAGTIGASALVSTTQAEAMLRILAEERKFNEFTIATAPFAEKLKIEPETVQNFYDENKKRFEVPEQVKAEYIVLSIDALMPQVTVSAAEIESWYESHKDRYLGVNDASKEKARAQAEKILEDARQDSSRFADLAKQHSKDTGSAEKGGDLGFFGRGMMVKPFEDAVFSLKEGEISGLVESDFGYHIIKVTGIHDTPEERRASHILIAPEPVERTLAEVRGEIEDELKRETAARQFAESTEAFSNLVYDESDSLQPAADRFKLSIQQTGWIPRNADPRARAELGPLDNDEVLADLFSADAVKDKRNTKAIEVAPNTLLAARVAEHAAATIRPFDTVRDEIEKMLKDEEAMKQARAEGEARLAELRQGEDEEPIAWSETREISRMQAAQSQLPPEALRALFKADVRKLPVYVGIDTGDAYTLFRITETAQPKEDGEDQLKSLKSEYAGIVAQEDISAYLSSLRSRYKIDINQSLLENRERQ